MRVCVYTCGRAAAAIGPKAIRARNGADVRRHSGGGAAALDRGNSSDNRNDGRRDIADTNQPLALSTFADMRAGWRAAVVVLMSLVAIACSSVLDKEVARVSRTTCPSGGPFQSSRTRTDTGRITASWSCPAPSEWGAYLITLDAALTGYQRKASTKDSATYARHEPGDSYVLQLSLVHGTVSRLDGKLRVGPD